MVWPSTELAREFQYFQSNVGELSTERRDFVSQNLAAFALASCFENGHIVALSQSGIQLVVRTWAAYCDAFDLPFENEELLIVEPLLEDEID